MKKIFVPTMQNVMRITMLSISLVISAAPSNGSPCVKDMPCQPSEPSGSASGMEPSSVPQHPGLLPYLEHAKGRALTPNERKMVHDALKTAVQEWRRTQDEFLVDTAKTLHTTTAVIDQTLPAKGWARVGAAQAPTWMERLEQALGRPLTVAERKAVEIEREAKHARILASRRKASTTIAKALGMNVQDVEAGWPVHRHNLRSSS